MKDSELREELQSIDDVLTEHTTAINSLRLGIDRKLTDVFRKDCPKCKHPVLAERKIMIDNSQNPSNWLPNTFIEYFQCLTCGSKFTCTEKCVCELIDG